MSSAELLLRIKPFKVIVSFIAGSRRDGLLFSPAFRKLIELNQITVASDLSLLLNEIPQVIMRPHHRTSQ